MEHIKFIKKDGVATITLNRPNSYNSFIRPMAFEMQEVLTDCEKDETIRCVVVTGEGKAFCAGQDLKEVTNPDIDFGFEEILKEHYEPIVYALRSLQKPVVAAVNGVAAGAGANLALACDIVVAKESVQFIQAFSAIGLIPDGGGTYFLPRLIGFQKAMAIAMLGDRISAVEAEKMGMIYQAVPDEKFEETIVKLSHTLSNMPTKGLAFTKQLFNASLNNTLKEQLDLENKLQIAAARTEDYQEGVAAFLEKRQPKFKGK